MFNYNDLLIEIEIYKEQLEFANDTAKKLEALLNIRKPKDIKAMPYDNIANACRDDTTDDRTYTRLYYTNKRIEAYTEILEGLQEKKASVEMALTKCEGLNYKVFYLLKIKGYSKYRISEELNYSISYIEKICAEINAIWKYCEGVKRKIMKNMKLIKICKIGKKLDKSDCAKKDCENCRHYIDDVVFED